MNSKVATSKLNNEDPGVTPGLYDVLCERGARANLHTGNKALTRLCDIVRGAYRGAANVFVKRFIRDFVIQWVRDNGGRFLARTQGTGDWHELPEGRVKTKLSQKLREHVVDGHVRAAKRNYYCSLKKFNDLAKKKVSPARLRQAQATMHCRKVAYDTLKKTASDKAKRKSDMFERQTLTGQTKEDVYEVLNAFVEEEDSSVLDLDFGLSDIEELTEDDFAEIDLLFGFD